MIETAVLGAETNDKDYIFMAFVMNLLPVAIVGLLFALIFSAAMWSTSSVLNVGGPQPLISTKGGRSKAGTIYII
jgi:Na+/proline symporter